MPRPLIGITTYGRTKRNNFILPAEYVDSVRRAGAEAVLLPPGTQDAERLLDGLEGLILAGGGDIDPSVYGGKAHETIYMADDERDKSELELTLKIVASGLPTLCICRGTQILNVALGGTLHEHLPDVFGEDVAHRLPPREPTEHPIKVKEDSELGRLLGQSEFTAASWHHQAIRDVADSLEVVAHAPDGVIEALEKPDHPWLYAVQWHPELTAAKDPLQQKLFNELVRASHKADES